MPSVRDILKGDKPSRNENAQDGPELDGAQLGEGQEANQADLISARLRETADQRAALAQTEINRLQNHIQQLQQRMEELTKQQMPPGNLSADLKDAQVRLEDAEADLARANEAKQNTELTSSLRQEHQEPSLHVDHTTHQGHGQGGAGVQKVGAAIGHTGAQPKVGGKGFKRGL